MRTFLLVIAVIVCVGETAGAQNSIRVTLKKQSIELEDRAAVIGLDVATPFKVLAMIRDLKKVDYVEIRIEDPQFAVNFLKGLSNLPSLETLVIHAKRLGEKEIAGMVQLKTTGRIDLTLSWPDITDVEAKQLQALRNVKTLRDFNLLCLNLSPKAVAQLKAALPQVKDFSIVVDYPSRMLKMVNVTPKDNQLTKLKKEKLIAALKTLQAYYDEILVGRMPPALDFVACGKLVRDAAFDVNDRELTKKIIDDHVSLMEFAHAICKEKFAAGIQDAGAKQYYAFLYAYIDAQIVQLRLKKEDAK